MLQALRVLGVTAVIAGSLATPAANARGFGDEPLYSYEWYSDATYTTLVGHAWGVCYADYAGISPIQGVGSAYEVRTQVGICRNGQAIYM